MSWFRTTYAGMTGQGGGRASATPYAPARQSPTPYAMDRPSPTPYPGATSAAKAGLVAATSDGKRGGLGGFLAATFANPFGKEKRGAVKDLLTSPNPFGSKARGAVGTVTGLWGGGDAPRGGGTARTIGAMVPPVTMRAPDGSTRQVPLADAKRYQALGAEIVG